MQRQLKQTMLFLLTLTLSVSVIPVRSLAASDAQKLLQKADSIRNPSSDYKMRISVKTPDSSTEFEVFLKGTDKTLIVTKAPAKDKGRNMLMLDRDFYAYVPNLKRSVRLSLAQKLSGQVANGDISRTRWFGDYDVVTEKQDGKKVQLLLNGKKDGLTYQKIRLWVEGKTARPINAEYLSLDGKTVLKRAFFENYKSMAGAQRPSVIRIVDTNQQASSIEISSMEPQALSETLFTERNMESAH